MQLSILSNPPPAEDLPFLPVSHNLTLDPWLEPLPSPGPAPYTESSTATSAKPFSSNSQDTVVDRQQLRNSRPIRTPRMLVIDSEGFTLWQDHFVRLKNVVETWEQESGKLLTLGESLQPRIQNLT
jgi:platelet-activating factor acetylhydrolase